MNWTWPMKFLRRTPKSEAEIPEGFRADFNAMNEYVRAYPTHQAAVDMFDGEWSSYFPPEYGIAQKSDFPGFKDDRVKWALERLGGVDGKRVLELGPLEGGHTHMLEKAGAASILALEANKRAFMKCLITKEVTGMQKARFMLGDFNEYMRNPKEQFDVCFACGVLYHMTNPVETIALIGTVAKQVFIWTHYYDKDRVQTNLPLLRTMGGAHKTSHGGFDHVLHKHFYHEHLSVPAFCGGPNPHSFWLTREGLLGALKHAGFTRLEIAFDQPDHVGGPAICIVGHKD